MSKIYFSVLNMFFMPGMDGRTASGGLQEEAGRATGTIWERTGPS